MVGEQLEHHRHRRSVGCARQIDLGSPQVRQQYGSRMVVPLGERQRVPAAAPAGWSLVVDGWTNGEGWTHMAVSWLVGTAGEDTQMSGNMRHGCATTTIGPLPSGPVGHGQHRISTRCGPSSGTLTSIWSGLYVYSDAQGGTGPPATCAVWPRPGVFATRDPRVHPGVAARLGPLRLAVRASIRRALPAAGSPGRTSSRPGASSTNPARPGS